MFLVCYQFNFFFPDDPVRHYHSCFQMFKCCCFPDVLVCIGPVFIFTCVFFFDICSFVPVFCCSPFQVFLFSFFFLFRCSCFPLSSFFPVFLFSIVLIFRCSCFPWSLLSDFLFFCVPIFRCSCFPVFQFLCSCCLNAEARRSRLC